MMRTTLPALLALALTACADDMEVADSDAFDEAGDTTEEIDAEELIGPAAASLSGDDIGVIPDTGVNCPGKRLTIKIYAETDDNDNETSGWYGDWRVPRKIEMIYCKVSSDAFKPVKSTLASDNYAVLKLGASCPPGSYDLVRYMDGNDLSRGLGQPPYIQHTEADKAYPPTHHGGTQGSNLWLHMCAFKAVNDGSNTPFPNLGFRYGVLGGPGLPGALDTGWVKSDDEDDDNGNRWEENAGNIDFSSIATGGRNTKFFLTRVR